MPKRIKVGFIGGGNMGEALIAGLIRKKVVSPSQIGVSEPDPKRASQLRKKHRISSFTSNKALVAASSSVILAIKPQQMRDVLLEIRPLVAKNKLLISIAAGLDTNYFFKLLPKNTRFIRVMPNLCAMIGEGATALFAAPRATSNDKRLAQKIFEAAGKVVFVKKENLLDAVTAVSGSGPAFVFLFAQSLLEAGISQGLPAELTKTLVLQTLLGSTRLMETSKDPIPTLINRVASKKGTTEAGLKVLAKRRLPETIRQTITAATKRAKELRCTS